MHDYFAPRDNIRTKATIDLALKWFVLCALEESCMAPADSHLNCDFSRGYTYHTVDCHRYDQSAINLILGPYPKSLLGPWARVFALTNRDADETQIHC